MVMLQGQGLANGAQGNGEPPEGMPQRKWAHRHLQIEDELVGRPLFTKMDQWGCPREREWPMGCRAIWRPQSGCQRGPLDQG